jgi:hypothetical protein
VARGVAGVCFRGMAAECYQFSFTTQVGEREQHRHLVMIQDTMANHLDRRQRTRRGAGFEQNGIQAMPVPARTGKGCQRGGEIVPVREIMVFRGDENWADITQNESIRPRGRAGETNSCLDNVVELLLETVTNQGTGIGLEGVGEQHSRTSINVIVMDRPYVLGP